MAKGYSVLIAQEIREANQSLLGVQLGRICLEKDIPVTDVSEFFGVSRVTVYSWFRGKAVVSGKYSDKMKRLVEKLNS